MIQDTPVTMTGTIEKTSHDLPSWVLVCPLIFSFIVMVVAAVYFRSNFIPLFYIYYGIAYILLFFLGSRLFYNKWISVSDDVFARKLILTSMVIRLFTVVFLYLIFINQSGVPFEPYAVDSYSYHSMGKQVASLMTTGSFNASQFFYFDDIDDFAQPLLVGILYYLFGPHEIVFRLFNAIIGCLTVFIFYKMARMTFDRNVARLAAIMLMLYPSVLYYTGLHLKETMMIFLTILTMYAGIKIINNTSRLRLSSALLFFAGLIPIFFFRIPLGIILLASFAVYTILYQFINWRYIIIKFVTGVGIIFFTVFLLYDTPVHTRIENLYQRTDTVFEKAMNYRASREGGNPLALKATIPLLFVLGITGPNPSLVHIFSQDALWFENAGKFVMNMIAIFTILGFLYVLRNRSPEHLFIITVLFCWIFVFSIGGYGTSGRFHLITQPLLLLYASQGIISITKNRKHYYILYWVVVSIIILLWNYLKLYGRGFV